MKKSLFSRQGPGTRNTQDPRLSRANVRAISPRSSGSSSPEQVVIRPNLTSRRGVTSKLSFGGTHDVATNNSHPAKGHGNKRPHLAPASQTLKLSRRISDDLDFTVPEVEDRPSYSRDDLLKLKNATPSIPSQFPSEVDRASSPRPDLDKEILSKFGPPALANDPPSGSTIIPSEMQIREKKQRRARLAQELAAQERQADYISLEEPPKYPKSKLEFDDDHIAEEFSEFVNDGGIPLGRAAQKRMEAERRANIANMIASAHDAGSESESMDELERHAAYEATQFRHGEALGKSRAQHRLEQDHLNRPRLPSRFLPIPGIAEILKTWRFRCDQIEEEKQSRLAQIEKLREKKQELLRSSEWVQARLIEAGENYERLRAQAFPAPDHSKTLDRLPEAADVKASDVTEAIPKSPSANSDVEMVDAQYELEPGPDEMST